MASSTGGWGSRHRSVPANAVRELLELDRNAYPGWNVKHFHEHLVRDHRGAARIIETPG
jgi:hypothetical protein